MTKREEEGTETGNEKMSGYDSQKQLELLDTWY